MTSLAARVVVVLVLVSSSAQAADDEFSLQHARGVAANTYGGFTIRFKDGRREFRIGERIQVELVYARPGCGAYANRVHGTHGASCRRVRFDRAVTEHPRVDSMTFSGMIPGGILGGEVSTPLVVPFTLTDLYRFDATGPYRMFVESRQITENNETSNMLEFEILPRDPAWESQVLERSHATLADPTRDPAATERAFAELRALGTHEAAAILACFYETGDRELRGTSEIWEGLISNVDRSFVIAALRAELTDPERQISYWFMPGLALLEITHRQPSGPPSHDEYLNVMRQLAVERANALRRIPGRLEREIHRELTDFAADEFHYARGGVTRAAPDFPAETTAAFLDLAPTTQAVVLLTIWKRFKDPAFLPLIRSLVTSSTASEHVRDVALRRFHELAPREARATMIAELGREQPRVSTATLGRLRDETFPELEPHWLRLLQNASSDAVRASAAERLQRFGTRNGAAAVERFYHRADKSLTCSTRAALLAYLVRVDGRRGEPLLKAAAVGGVWKETCRSTLIEAVAEFGWSPAVESAAFVALADPDLELARYAASLLAAQGSAAAREPLEARLSEVQITLASLGKTADALEDSPVWELRYLEVGLADALNRAKSWMLTPEERERLAATCSDASEAPRGFACRGAFRRDEHADPPHSVLIRAHGDEEPEFEFSVAGFQGNSLRDLHEKLRQFPAGTRVHWDDSPNGYDNSLERRTWSERDALFERFRREAASYGVILQREREYTFRDPAFCPE